MVIIINNDYRLEGNNNVIYDLTVTFTPNFFNEFESAVYPYDFMRLTNDLGILRLSEETYLQGLEDILKLRSVVNIERTIRMAPLSQVSQGVTDGIVSIEEIGELWIWSFKYEKNV
ncbi:hypothetical protein KQI18_03120 [Clostridioides mangenotii]|uniref:hypothetical protein n=1 Tax=Metaclostridioides mangenotii TaxID=1540 RepID=UPI001C0F4B90|nr:hypothetical protein [Clostridioides mangenotii]MBU5306770.1 hypothetical protein [Clostridioides mangenotii]